ncbi:MAG: type IV pilus assembly protein PilM [Gemmataceae bacterium]
MANATGVWGIDIGQCALKALRLELIDGQPTATAFDYIEHPKILSQPDADPDALTRESLQKFLDRNKIGPDEVAIGVAGQSGLARFVKLPPVEEKKIGDIVKFEAKQQIPFPLEEVVWDFQKIAGGDAVGGFAMETEIGLFAMKRDIINKYLGHYQSVGAEVHYVQMAPLALCNYATYELLRIGGPGGSDTPGVPLDEGQEDDTPRGKKRCAVVLDVGTDSSNLIITDGGKVIWQRPVPLGGSHFTRALTKEMKLTYAKAEHLKRNAAKSPDLAQILRSLRPVLTEFVGEVQRSLGYFTNTHRDAHVAYLVGLGSAFKLPGLQKYLAEKLSLDVRKPAGIARLSGDQVLNDPTFQENLLTFPVAYGLALQGLGLARLKTNLIPREVVVDRQIRAKKPAVAAAVAAMLFGTGVFALGNGVQYSAVTDSSLVKAKEDAKKAVDLSNGQAATHVAKAGEITTSQNEVKAIVVGGDERLNWIRMQEVLVTTLPRHGFYDDSGKEIAGSNLLDPDQVPFWNTQKGRLAYRKLQERLATGIPIDKLFDDDLSDHLAQVSLESVYARYIPSFGDFLTAADQFGVALTGRNIADDMLEAEREDDPNQAGRKKPKAPDGGGWVIELRGTTNYRGDSGNEGLPFLRKCLLKNLQKFNDFAALYNAEKKVAEVIPDGKDPIKGNASHPFLLFALRDDNPQGPTTFQRINQSYADRFVRGGGVAGGGAPGGLTPGDTGSGDTGAGGPGGGRAMPGAPGGGMPGGGGGGGWSPLGGSSLSGAAGGGGLMGGMGMPGGGMEGGMPAMPGRPMAPGGTGLGPLGPVGGGGPGGAAATPGTSKIKPRYEFVAFIFWKEPTPTDPTPGAGQ